MATALFHVSAWRDLVQLAVGDTVELRPGTQGAEGVGVYFAEGEPCPRASDSVHLDGAAAVIRIEVASPAGWWRTKPSVARKYGRPRTWHTQGRCLHLRVTAREEWQGIPLLYCREAA